jgi:hypothetical protein
MDLTVTISGLLAVSEGAGFGGGAGGAPCGTFAGTGENELDGTCLTMPPRLGLAAMAR